ncbi:MAG: hypothetical protein AAB634_01125 [Patescibacteria group bacterium]
MSSVNIPALCQMREWEMSRAFPGVCIKDFSTEGRFVLDLPEPRGDAVTIEIPDGGPQHLLWLREHQEKELYPALRGRNVTFTCGGIKCVREGGRLPVLYRADGIFSIGLWA